MYKPLLDATALQLQDGVIMDLEPGYIEPPARLGALSEEAKAYWDELILGKPKRAWMQSDLIMLHDLCKQYVIFNEERKELLEEGNIFVNDKGAKYRNPRLGVVSVLRREISHITRYLAIDPSHTSSQTLQAVREFVDPKLDNDGLLK